MYMLAAGSDWTTSLSRAANSPHAPEMVHGPDIASLSLLQLHADADASEIRAYIWDILSLSAVQNAFSPSDPQVKMLAAVGGKNLYLLLETFAETDLDPLDMASHVLEEGWRASLGPAHPLRVVYVLSAIEEVCEADHRAVVVELLPRFPDLVRVVNRMNWQEDAREALIRGLNDPDARLPADWMQAVVALNDPSTYNRLRELFVAGPDWSRMFNVIRHVPEIGIEAAVGEVWQRVRNDAWGRADMAPVAVGFGHRDALGYLIGRLEQKRTWPPASVYREMVLQYIDFKGTNRDIVEWFEKNENALRFDTDRSKFFVP